MARPTGLIWEDRIGTDAKETRWWFDCHRKGHPKVARVFDLKSDAKQFRVEHDAKCHSSLGPQLRRPSIQLVALLEEHLTYLRGLAARGARSQKTIYHYAYHHHSLVRCLGRATDVFSLGRPEIARYIERRFAETSATDPKRRGTGGAVIVKELKDLKAAIAWKFGAAACTWTVPIDDIKPKRDAQRKITRDELVRFLAHLDGEARVIVLLKLRTGLHNVEIEALRVGDLDLERRVLFTLIAKKARGERQAHAVAITDDLAAELAPLLTRRSAEEYLFKRRQIRSLRDYFIEASNAAGITPPITAIGLLRHHWITWSTNSFGTATTARTIGHRSEYTTSLYLIDDGDLEAKRKVAEAIASLVPATGTHGAGGTDGGTDRVANSGTERHGAGNVIGITARRHGRNALKPR